MKTPHAGTCTVFADYKTIRSHVPSLYEFVLFILQCVASLCYWCFSKRNYHTCRRATCTGCVVSCVAMMMTLLMINIVVQRQIELYNRSMR